MIDLIQHILGLCSDHAHPTVWDIWAQAYTSTRNSLVSGAVWLKGWVAQSFTFFGKYIGPSVSRLRALRSRDE